MRIFMTGATGYIGGAVATELRRHGHEVTALVRPASEVRHLRDLEVVVLAGDLESLPALGEALSGYDAYVHVAYSREHDRQTIDTLAPLGGHFIYTSGVLSLGNTQNADETTPPNPLRIAAWRVEHESVVLKSSSGAVIRPGFTYGGKKSPLSAWFAAVDQKQPIHIVGDGKNRWAMVNIHDLAACYAAAAEQRATGMLHAIDDTHETLEVCARALSSGVEIRYTEGDHTEFAEALMANQNIGSSRTRERLGWTPKRTFLSSIDEQWREWRESRAAGS